MHKCGSLRTPAGAAWIHRLAGPVFAAAVLLSGGAGLAAETPGIGVTAIVVKQVEGVLSAERRQLALADDVYRNEVVATGQESASEIHLADDTRVTVGPNSQLVLDEFVYDGTTGQGNLALHATQGVFRFFSGQMPHESYKIGAPAVSIGVRGTVLVVVIREDGAVAVILESDDGIDVTDAHDRSLLIDRPGLATVTLPDGSLSPPGPPPAWALERVRAMDRVIASASAPFVPMPLQRAETGDRDVAEAPPHSPPPDVTPPPDPEDDPPPPDVTPPSEPDDDVTPPPADDPAPPTGSEDDDKERGIPRAEDNQDPADMPDGLEQAEENADPHATDPGPVPGGNGKSDDGDDEAAGDSGGPGNSGDAIPEGVPAFGKGKGKGKGD